MRRRALLRTTGVALAAALTGCQSTGDGTDAPPTRTDDESPAPSPSPASPGTRTATTRSSDGLPYTVSLSRDDNAYQVVAHEEGDVSRVPVRTIEFVELDGETKAAVRTAIESGTYRAQNRSALPSGMDRILDWPSGERYVAYQGSVYRLDVTVPVDSFALDHEVDVPANASGRVLDLGDDPFDRLRNRSEALAEAFGNPLILGANEASTPYRTTDFSEPLVSLLEQYEYVTYYSRSARIVVNRTDPTAPYTIDATELSLEELHGREIRQLGELPPETRRVVERLLASSRRTPFAAGADGEHFVLRLDDPPPGLREVAPVRADRESPYISAGGRLYELSLAGLNRDRTPLTVGASLTDAQITVADPAAIRMTLTNEGSEPHLVTNLGVRPFGLLWAHGPTGNVLLESDYRKSDNVESLSPEIDVSLADWKPVPPGGTVSDTYRFGTDPGTVEPGTYTVWGGVLIRDQPPAEGRPPDSNLYELRLTVA